MNDKIVKNRFEIKITDTCICTTYVQPCAAAYCNQAKEN